MGIKARAKEYRENGRLASIAVTKEKETRKSSSLFTAIAIVFLCALLVQGTFAWIHLTQHVNGALLYIHETYPVELHKYERQADGTYTEIPMEDVGFVLYKENGEQVESVFWTDEDGKIYVDLPVGNYFWKEIYYTTGWGPDIDEDGKTILTYPFEVTEDIEEDDPLIVVAYNLPLEADLEVEKIVVNLDGSDLTDSQLDQVFEFYIYFSDEGTYKYYITDASNVISSYIESDYRELAVIDEDIEWLEITSREMIYLKHGQVAVIQDLPVGITYSVHETRVVNYYTDSVGHLGNIVYGENRAVFTNTYDPVFGSILVSKEVVNADESELTQDQLNKEFLFTATIDGEEVQFVLKHGEEHLIEDIPVGTKYRVEEFDYVDDEYYATVLVYEGEILGEYEHYLPFVNVYDPEEELGDLIVRKVLVSTDGEELDYDLEFTFEVTFEYEDGTSKTEEFTLKGDELGDPSLWKIFEGIPVGTKYSIREINSNGYLAESDYIEGYIIGYSAKDTDEAVAMMEESIEDAVVVMADVLEDVDGVIEDKNPAIEFGQTNEEPVVVSESKTILETLLEGGVLRADELELILESLQVVTFYNRPEVTKTLEITKEVVGVVPTIHEDKEFLIRLYVDGELFEEFTLTAGEMKSFELPKGVTYEVWEEDYYGDGYSQLIVGGYGTIWSDVTEVTVINDYIWEEVDIEGEKTWSDDESALEYIPDSIVVRLMLGDLVVQEQVVEPNSDGLWLYEFAAPKYDMYGEELEYSVVEVPVDYFYATYDGYDIHNHFAKSILVLLPVLEKQVIGENAPQEKFGFVLRGLDGAPMPVGTLDDELVYIQYGEGEQALGEIRYTQPGVYSYTIRELLGDSLDWNYDARVYDLKVVVEEIDGELRANYTLYLGEEVVDRAVFVNEYAPEELDEPDPFEPEVLDDEVVISGSKTWNHGSNPIENQPKNLVVYLVAGEDVVRAIELSNSTNWSYSFTVPKYDEWGELIEYSVEEELVSNYVASSEGYNLINTYDENSHGDSSETKTGDYTNVFGWILAMVISFGLWVAVVYGKKSRY